MGRPSLYTPELADRICQRLAEGESLLSICRDDEMPSRPTVHKWVTEDTEGFAAKYAHAREAGCDVMAEQLMEIADDGRNDFMAAQANEDGEGGAVKFDAEHVQRSKLRVDARKWYLSKIAPKRYGDKQQVEHSGTVSIADALREARERMDES